MADVTSEKGGPRCPNHRVKLVDLSKGIGICPISDARFTYDGEEAKRTRKLFINSMGQMEESANWKVENIDGKDD